MEKKSRENIMNSLDPDISIKFFDIARAFFGEIPGMSASHSGWDSMTSKLSVPNFSMIFAAVFGPIPFTAPDAR